MSALVVGFVGPYSRVSFETSSAEGALACIGRVDRGVLEAGLVDIRYRGRMGESLLPLLMECEGVSVEGWRVSVAARFCAALGARSPACLLRLGRGVDVLVSLPRPAFVYALPVWWLFSWVRGAWRGCFFPVFVRASA